METLDYKEEIEETPTIDKAVIVGVKDNIKEILSKREKRTIRRNMRKIRRKPKKRKIKKWERAKLGNWKTTNTHHIISRSEGWTNYIDNLVEMEIPIHQALHLLFNNLPPHLIIEDILNYSYQVMEPSTRDWIINEIKSTIDFYLNTWYFYNNKCIWKK